MNIRPDLTLIEQVSAMLRDMLGDDYDEQTFTDTLDGETDAFEVMDRLLADMQSDEALADAVKAQASALAARANRISARASAKKRTLKLVLDATGLPKAERPLGTVSKRAGSVSVQITDESAVPSQLCKTTVTPDKTAIRKQIEAGVDVPGAELVRGEDTISVRVA